MLQITQVYQDFKGFNYHNPRSLAFIFLVLLYFKCYDYSYSASIQRAQLPWIYSYLSAIQSYEILGLMLLDLLFSVLPNHKWILFFGYNAIISLRFYFPCLTVSFSCILQIFQLCYCYHSIGCTIPLFHWLQLTINLLAPWWASASLLHQCCP